MPLPNPKDGEEQDKWTERCMSNDMMKNEFPDNKQRLAVCFQKWRDKDKEKKSEDSQMERRYITKAEFRIESEENEPTIIGGYAAVFNRWSEAIAPFNFKEKIKKGAFMETIGRDDVRALINHDPNLIIGRTANKTLKLWEDDDGLGFEVKLPETSYAADLVESIRRKDITQNSFGFLVEEDGDEWSSDRTKRTLTKVRLFDVSPVTFPAYKQTTVAVRLMEMGIDYEKLSAALFRAEQGGLTDEDVDLFDSVIGILKCHMPVKETAVIPPTEAVEPDYSAFMKARLARMAINKLLKE